ncbi:Hypp2151 [Branchiostoma lanceolatum]|uniref:Hypp2151 protein n=1 Tax=Branchiostoma lanceolatum TaxID=7740 RepID=A0A8J9ZRQ0_BRALA|nr:Hypp2151 [Branchiostoma lanceolatum]
MNHETLAWRRRRRRRCDWHWNGWSACSAPCGASGTQTRTASGCGAPGPQTQACNRFCHNGGTLLTTWCSCLPGWIGTCCERACTWQWNSWSSCSAPCGTSGTQTRTARGCGAPGPETQACNRFCHNGGTPLTSSCHPDGQEPVLGSGTVGAPVALLVDPQARRRAQLEAVEPRGRRPAPVTGSVIVEELPWLHRVGVPSTSGVPAAKPCEVRKVVQSAFPNGTTSTGRIRGPWIRTKDLWVLGPNTLPQRPRDATVQHSTELTGLT